MRKFMTLCTAIAALAALVLLSGCHSSPVAGTWKQQGGQGAGMSLVVGGDNQFTMNMMGSTLKGTAALEGKTLTLTPTEVDGKAPSTEEEKKPVTVTLSEDGKTLAGKDGLITLEKQ